MNIDKYGSTRISAYQDRELLDIDFQYGELIGNAPKSGKVLEIGPGNGSFSVYLKNKFGLDDQNITLLDISASTVNQLKEREETSAFNLVLKDTIDYLSSTRENYDLIVMRHVLEHMDKDYISKLIPILDQRLQNGGRIVIELPNFLNMPYGMWTCFGDFSHMTVFTPETLNEAFLWHFNSRFSMKTVPVKIRYPRIKFSVKNILSGFVYFATRKLSTVLSGLLYGGDRFGTGKAFTPLFTAIITKGE